MAVNTEPCGCIVTTNPGHVHTKLCPACREKCFAIDRAVAILKSADNVGDKNLDLVGG